MTKNKFKHDDCKIQGNFFANAYAIRIVIFFSRRAESNFDPLLSETS